MNEINFLVQLTNKCNWNCVGCIGSEWMSYKLPKDVDTEYYCYLIFKMITSFGNPLPRIELGWGSEPMVHPEFSTIYYTFIRSGINTDILTNGSRLKMFLYDGYKFDKETVLRMSVLGGLIPPNSYRGITGKSFNSVVENVKLLNDNCVKPVLAMTQDFDELESLGSMLNMLDGLNFAVRFKRIFPFNKGFIGHKVIEGYMKKFFPNIEYINGELRNSFDSIGFSECTLFPRFGIVLNGDVLFCCNKTGLVLGNIFKEDPSDVGMKIKSMVNNWNYNFENCDDCEHYANNLIGCF